MARAEAFYLRLEGGGRFCLLYPAVRPASCGGAVLYVHPFAEELNKSRRMVALQARALAEAGHTVLQIDLYGCGDSAGEFGAAVWECWVTDVIEAADWLRERTGRDPCLWGLRTGCLIATQAALQMKTVPDFVFWQPVLSGRQYLQQILRLRVANQLMGPSDGARIGTQQLYEQLERGENLEIAGYLLAPALALGMAASELAPPPQPARLAWFEVSGGAGDELSPAVQRQIQAWQAVGHRVAARVVVGLPFWQTQEIAECSALIGATNAAFHELHK